MSRLSQVGTSGQQIAEAVATALKLEVEIIDTDLVRVAATGRVRKNKGSRLARGVVNKYVLEKGLYVFVENAGFHEICQECMLSGHCYYQAYLVYPIKAGEEIIGTICLMAFDEEQKKAICCNHGSLVEFTSRMAELISSKVLGREMLAQKSVVASQLQAVVDSVHEGVIAFDQNDFLTHLNNSAEQMLGVLKTEIIGRKQEKLFEALHLNKILDTGEGYASREIYFNFGAKRLHFVATAKPIRNNEQEIAGAVVSFQDYSETQALAMRILSKQSTLTFSDIIGSSRKLQEILRQAKKVAGSNSTVLILGESGTGKEIFARAIHGASSFAHKPFIAVNCGAIPEALLESELFGYEEGAFTGARRGGKPGRFELANGGTLFLDEIGNMSLYLQAKLLRVLQERQIERVGGTTPIPVDIRVIAATNSNLQEMVVKGRFREDLYYRLSVIPLIIPPLRERKEDILELLEHYRARYCKLLGKEIQGFAKEVLKVCTRYAWPGNVRELINAVEYAINIEEGPSITLESLPPRIREDVSKKEALQAAVTVGREIPTLEELEKEAIIRALNEFGWLEEGKEQAANALGISRATIYRKIQKYHLIPEGQDKGLHLI